ncbi:hypothetical protein [Stenotrophomonas phage BUCT603]|nr:hypothetical protein [Stenotrophomonas phage BUCT603]
MAHHIGLLQLLSILVLAGGMLGLVTGAWLWHAGKGIIKHWRAGRCN